MLSFPPRDAAALLRCHSLLSLSFSFPASRCSFCSSSLVALYARVGVSDSWAREGRSE